MKSVTESSNIQIKNVFVDLVYIGPTFCKYMVGLYFIVDKLL
jgi:hypothetical protein